MVRPAFWAQVIVAWPSSVAWNAWNISRIQSYDCAFGSWGWRSTIFCPEIFASAYRSLGSEINQPEQASLQNWILISNLTDWYVQCAGKQLRLTSPSSPSCLPSKYHSIINDAILSHSSIIISIINCVTRTPLLCFIRSWVALFFKVCQWVSESGMRDTCPDLHLVQYIKA